MAILGLQSKGSGMRAVGRANNPLRCRRARCCNGNVQCKRQPAQTDLLSSLSRGAIHAWVVWVVGAPRIECSAVHRNVAHFVCTCALGGNLAPSIFPSGSSASSLLGTA